MVVYRKGNYICSAESNNKLQIQSSLFQILTRLVVGVSCMYGQHRNCQAGPNEEELEHFKLLYKQVWKL